MAINEGFKGGLGDEGMELRVLQMEQSLDDRGLLGNPNILLIDPLHLNRLERLGYLEVGGELGIWYVKS